MPNSSDASADTFTQEIERIETTKVVAGILPVRDIQDIDDLGSTLLWYCSLTIAHANSIFPRSDLLLTLAAFTPVERLTVSQLYRFFYFE